MAKHFKEVPGLVHYDIRYFRGRLDSGAQKAALVALFRAWSRLVGTEGINAFLMHGTLIGWFWNRRILPWDDDIDVCVLADGLARLDLLQHTYRDPRFRLEVNPNYTVRKHDPDNVIDARLIDTTCGLFIDITGLTATTPGRLACKSPHSYNKVAILPLHATTFEGAPALRPNDVEKVLVQEYGAKVTTARHFRGHEFADGEWRRKHAGVLRGADGRAAGRATRSRSSQTRGRPPTEEIRSTQAAEGTLRFPGTKRKRQGRTTT